MSQDITQLLSELLDELQHEMQNQDLWQAMPPPPEKMMSVEPFSIDQLDFLEWLQWIYIARLRAIIDAGSPLPTGAAVYAYGEEALKAESIKADSVLLIVKRLDQLLA